MSLLAALPMGALTLDQDLSVRSVNPVFLDLLGYKDTELLGRSFDGLVLPSQSGALVAWLACDEQVTLQLDVRFISARGGSLPASVAISKTSALTEARPRQLKVILEHLDREHALQQVLRIDEALSLAKVGNWELEIATGRILASQNWLDLWGLGAEEEVTLDQMLRRAHPLDRSLVETTLGQASSSSDAFHIRFRILRPDGHVRWAECAGRRYPDDSGLAGRICGAALDITEQRSNEQALARYADIVSATPDRILFVDRGCRIQAANAAFLRALDRSMEDLLGRTALSVCGDSQLSELLYRNLGQCLDESRSIVEDIRESGRDGKLRDLEVRLFPHHDEQGHVTGVVINIRDVTEIREAELHLLQSAAVYRATSEGVLITDAAGIIVRVNSAFTQITGYSESEVLGQKPSIMSSHWHSKGFFVGMWRQLLRQGSWQGEIWNRRKDGEVYRQRLTIRRVRDSRGKLASFVGVLAERPSSPEAPYRTEHWLHYDALTKLPNSLLFESRLEHAIELGERKDTALTVFILDLDHFSHINFSLGHQIGDDLLRSVALKLREAIRPADTLARLSADQFACLFEEIGSLEEVTEIALRLQQTLRTPIWVKSHLLHVNVSIGIAVSTDLGDDRRSMMTKAESALRQVKRGGRNAFKISTAEPNVAQAQHQRELSLLRTALAREDLRLLFQPGLDLHTGVCDYVEAFVHWEQAELGRVPLERFNSLASEIGLMREIGDWALQTACAQLQDWLDRGLPIARQGIKISETQLIHGHLIQQITRILDDKPAIAPHLVLELSESLLLKHREQIAEIFQGLSQLGVDIMLCDVGIGWTAPAVLQRLPITALKIHPSFIAALPGSAHELAVVEVLIAMAQSLHFDIRAEGVRTPEQKYQLMDLGCTLAQGDLFSAPLTQSQLEAWLGSRGKQTPPSPRKS